MLDKFFAKKKEVEFLRSLVKNLMKDVEELSLEVKILRKEIEKIKSKK